MPDDEPLVQLNELELTLTGIGETSSLALQVVEFEPNDEGWGLIQIHARSADSAAGSIQIDASFSIQEYVFGLISEWHRLIQDFLIAESLLRLPLSRVCRGALWLAITRDKKGHYIMWLNLSQYSRGEDAELFERTSIGLAFIFETWHMNQLANALQMMLQRMGAR